MRVRTLVLSTLTASLVVATLAGCSGSPEAQTSPSPSRSSASPSASQPATPTGAPSTTGEQTSPTAWLNNAIDAVKASTSFAMTRQELNLAVASATFPTWTSQILTDYGQGRYLELGDVDGGLTPSRGADGTRYYVNMHEGDPVVVSTTPEVIKGQWDAELPWTDYRTLVSQSTSQAFSDNQSTLTVTVPTSVAQTLVTSYADSVPAPSADSYPTQWTFTTDAQGRLATIAGESAAGKKVVGDTFDSFGAALDFGPYAAQFEESATYPVTDQATTVADLQHICDTALTRPQK